MARTASRANKIEQQRKQQAKDAVAPLPFWMTHSHLPLGTTPIDFLQDLERAVARRYKPRTPRGISFHLLESRFTIGYNFQNFVPPSRGVYAVLFYRWIPEERRIERGPSGWARYDATKKVWCEPSSDPDTATDNPIDNEGYTIFWFALAFDPRT